MKGTVALEGLSFFAHHGFYEEERKIGNKYLIDVRVTFSIDDEWGQDDIALTLDYEKVYSEVKNVMGTSHKLLEKVAYEILSRVKGLLSVDSEVYVKVSKENPPIGAVCDYSTITLEG